MFVVVFGVFALFDGGFGCHLCVDVCVLCTTKISDLDAVTSVDDCIVIDDDWLRISYRQNLRIKDYLTGIFISSNIQLPLLLQHSSHRSPPLHFATFHQAAKYTKLCTANRAAYKLVFINTNNSNTKTNTK